MNSTKKEAQDKDRQTNMKDYQDDSNAEHNQTDDQSDNKKEESVERNIATEDSATTAKEASIWTSVWDDNAQSYYWWNTETNETTWINPEASLPSQTSSGTADSTATDPTTNTTIRSSSNSDPLDFLLDRIDNAARQKLEGKEETIPEENSDYYAGSYNQHNNDFDPSDGYTSQAHFNSRTGRFTTQDDANRLNPDNLTLESRAKRQMQYYFDVDNYTEERNQMLQAQEGRIGKKKQLSRKEVERFKQMKKEKKSKKAREWLMQ